MKEFEHKDIIPPFGPDELKEWENGLTLIDIQALGKISPEQRSDLQERVNDCLQDIQSAKEFLADGNLPVEKEWEELPEKAEKLIKEIEDLIS